MSNYRLFAIGSSDNPSFGRLWGPGNQMSSSGNTLWKNDNLLGNVVTYTDHMGITFNYLSRYLLVCGGLQVALKKFRIFEKYLYLIQ